MVMVVDDDRDTRVVVRLILETAGHLVIEAEHGEAALALYKSQPPDIITTDLMMPVLSGVRLIERLRSEPATATIPIVVVSGDPKAARALHAAGLVDAFVIKPFDATMLAQVIATIVSRFNSVDPAA